MPKSRLLFTFKTLALCNTTFSIEIQRAEFKSLWTKAKDAYETFAIGDEEHLEGDCKAARELFGHCGLGYINVAALMSDLSQTFVNRSEMFVPNGLFIAVPIFNLRGKIRISS